MARIFRSPTFTSRTRSLRNPILIFTFSTLWHKVPCLTRYHRQAMGGCTCEERSSWEGRFQEDKPLKLGENSGEMAKKLQKHSKKPHNGLKTGTSDQFLSGVVQIVELEDEKASSRHDRRMRSTIQSGSKGCRPKPRQNGRGPSPSATPLRRARKDPCSRSCGPGKPKHAPCLGVYGQVLS